ncbi:MAG: uroporphyrinogen-III synthase [Oceanicoccus sp.]|jgi:uroporphyrinogen-III synthase
MTEPKPLTIDERRVLLTRPAGQADNLLGLMAAAGAQAVHFPVMTITVLDEQDGATWQQCKQQIMALDEFQHVIFISTNAVNFGMECIHQYWPQLPVDIAWYGIGRATIAALQAEGVTVLSTVAAAMNSEALLQQPTLQQLSAEKVLIVRGVGGREYLAEQLQQRGAVVRYAQCYQRQQVSKSIGELNQLIAEHAINTLCINSGDSLEYVLALSDPSGLDQLKQLTLVAAGDRVAGLAKQQGFRHISVAENASDQAMLAALTRL